MAINTDIQCQNGIIICVILDVNVGDYWLLSMDACALSMQKKEKDRMMVKLLVFNITLR